MKFWAHKECSTSGAIRCAKLSLVLRSYADKARRHHLSADRYAELVGEIDRMIARGRDYVGADDPSPQQPFGGELSTVVRVHTTQNETLRRAFASLVFYGIYKGMFRRGIQSRITHTVIFDEAHRAASLKLIPRPVPS